MRWKSAVVVGLFASLALGCAGIRVYTDQDPSAAFAEMQTFAWLDPPLREVPRAEGASPADPFVHNTLLDKRVREAVETALVAKGYAKAEGEPADFQVRYEVVSREVVRDGPIYVDGGYGYGRYPYYRTGVAYSGSTSYQEGTLILDVIDPASESIAWRGWAASRTRDGHIDAARVSKTVEAILAKFPPERAAAAEESDPGAE